MSWNNHFDVFLRQIAAPHFSGLVSGKSLCCVMFSWFFRFPEVLYCFSLTCRSNHSLQSLLMGFRWGITSVSPVRLSQNFFSGYACSRLSCSLCQGNFKHVPSLDPVKPGCSLSESPLSAFSRAEYSNACFSFWAHRVRVLFCVLPPSTKAHTIYEGSHHLRRLTPASQKYAQSHGVHVCLCICVCVI